MLQSTNLVHARLYTRVPSDLSKVTDNSFIGVATVKQPDGSERATEIHVATRALAPGDQVAVLAKKAPDGSLTASQALSTAT